MKLAVVGLLVAAATAAALLVPAASACTGTVTPTPTMTPRPDFRFLQPAHAPRGYEAILVTTLDDALAAFRIQDGASAPVPPGTYLEPRPPEPLRRADPAGFVRVHGEARICRPATPTGAHWDDPATSERMGTWALAPDSGLAEWRGVAWHDPAAGYSVLETQTGLLWRWRTGEAPASTQLSWSTAAEPRLIEASRGYALVHAGNELAVLEGANVTVVAARPDDRFVAFQGAAGRHLVAVGPDSVAVSTEPLPSVAWRRDALERGSLPRITQDTVLIPGETVLRNVGGRWLEPFVLEPGERAIATAVGDSLAGGMVYVGTVVGTEASRILEFDASLRFRREVPWHVDLGGVPEPTPTAPLDGNGTMPEREAPWTGAAALGAGLVAMVALASRRGRP